ncbi:MAG TPA: PaaI family thioesterase [Thermoleophilaceae bacterium]
MSDTNGHARKLEIEWEDPRSAAARGLELAGIDYVRGIQAGELPPPPIALLLGMTIVEVEDGRAVFGVRPDERHYNPIGVVHGGLAATLIDSATGCAVQTKLPAGVGYTTVDLNVTFVRPIHADTGDIECEATVIHSGSRVATAEARVRRVSDGKVLAHGTSTCLVLG